MKLVVLSLIGAAAMFLAAGCEGDEHEEHHGHGGAYDGTYNDYGHEQWPGYPTREGYWDRSDDWRSH